ncbi:MAG TPA: hypothetical protein VGO91_19525 [Pyrinomonadaceae bacterium]|jgi:hypothetical protein|nr:hypothetical protein [Pyrinomonadaceae bacterium]
MTAQEFEKLCRDIYADRRQIYSFNPNVSHREALLWMLLGCLVSLLSVPILDQPSVYGGSRTDPYADAICELLKPRMNPAFNPRIYLDELTEKLKAEEA